MPYHQEAFACIKVLTIYCCICSSSFASSTDIDCHFESQFSSVEIKDVSGLRLNAGENQKQLKIKGDDIAKGTLDGLTTGFSAGIATIGDGKQLGVNFSFDIGSGPKVISVYLCETKQNGEYAASVADGKGRNRIFKDGASPGSCAAKGLSRVNLDSMGIICPK